MITQHNTSFTFIVRAVLFALLVVLCFRQISSPDIGLHLKAGHWIIDHHAFPALDTFNYNTADKPYIDTYWLYQVVIAAADRVGGEFAIVALHTLLIGLCIALALRRTRGERGGSGLGTGGVYSPGGHSQLFGQL